MAVLGSSRALLRSNVTHNVANKNLKIFSQNIKITGKLFFPPHTFLCHMQHEKPLFNISYMQSLENKPTLLLVPAKQVDLPVLAFTYFVIIEEYLQNSTFSIKRHFFFIIWRLLCLCTAKIPQFFFLNEISVKIQSVSLNNDNMGSLSKQLQHLPPQQKSKLYFIRPKNDY